LIQATTPPLSNYEQKQILDGLLLHSKDKDLTFDEAQTFAIDKAVEIGRIFSVSSRQRDKKNKFF